MYTYDNLFEVDDGYYLRYAAEDKREKKKKMPKRLKTTA